MAAAAAPAQRGAWTVEPIDVAQATADERDAAALGVEVGVPVVVRPFTLRGAHSDEPWAFALATYPLTALDADAPLAARP